MITPTNELMPLVTQLFLSGLLVWIGTGFYLLINILQNYHPNTNDMTDTILELIHWIAMWMSLITGIIWIWGLVI